MSAAAAEKIRWQRARVRSAMRDKAMVDRAVARLAGKLNIRSSEAAEYLEQIAQNGGLSLIEAAKDVQAPPRREFPRPALPDWVQSMLETHEGSASYSQPISDSVDRTIDFVVHAVNSHGRTADGRRLEDMIGKSLLEISPGIAGAGLLDGLIAAYDSGVPFHRESLEYVEIRGDRAWPLLMNVRSARILDGLLLNTRMLDKREIFFSSWERVQRLAGLGWAEWDLASQEVFWTPLVYEMFGRDIAEEPIALEDIPAMAVPQDAHVLGDVIDSLIEGREPIEAEFRIQHRHGIRQLRTIGEPLLDGDGIPLKIRMLVQDLTEARHHERASIRAHDRAARDQEHAADESLIITRLRNTLLPPERRVMHLPGLAVGLHYLPTEHLAQLGGDFFTARQINDDKVLLAVGDAMGHGLTAVGTMHQMRSGLAGLAYTGAPPDQLATWLNELILHINEEVTTTGTAIIGHFDIADRTFAWTNAGHLNPLLIREGRTETLQGAMGPLLGGIDCDYELNTAQLQPADCLLLYTDGLVERRGQDIDTGIQALVQAAQSCTACDPEELIDYVLQRVSGEITDDDVCILAARVL